MNKNKCFVSLQFFTEESKDLFDKVCTSLSKFSFDPIHLKDDEVQKLEFGLEKMTLVSEKVLTMMPGSDLFLYNLDLNPRDLGGLIELDLARAINADYIYLSEKASARDLILDKVESFGKTYYLIMEWFAYPKYFSEESFTEFPLHEDFPSDEFRGKTVQYRIYHEATNLSQSVDLSKASIPLKGFIEALKNVAFY